MITYNSSTYVPAEGSLDSKIVIIGEAPGSDEEALKRPFVGSSGRILDHKLHFAKINRNDCYVTNLVKLCPVTFKKTYPEFGLKTPKNNYDFNIFWQGHKPTKALLECREQLMDELSKLTNVKLIITLGASAMWALTGHSQIGKWRGTVIEKDNFITLPTYHPDSLVKEWELGALMSYDLKKAYQIVYQRFNWKPLNRNLIIRPTLEQVQEFVVKSGWYPEFEQDSYNYVAFDIETSPGKITCISLAYNKNEAISIPLTVEYWKSYSTLRVVIDLVRILLVNPNLLKIGHNLAFDIQYLARFFNFKVAKPWFDTMIAFHSMYSELPKKLYVLSSIYTNEPYYKDDLKVWQGGAADEVLWRYNALDSAVTIEIAEILMKEMKTLNVEHTFNFMMDLVEPLLFMTLSGLEVDKSKISGHRVTLSTSLSNRESNFSEQFKGVNPHSQKQVKELAYETLGLDPITKDGKATVDKKALDKLSKKNPHIAEVINIRNERKLISTYLDMEQDPADGKLRFSLNSTGTVTGRLSSSASLFGGGSNLQNVPKKLRDMVVPRDGMMFTEADLKGAEAMVVAYLCDDPVLINKFKKDENIHTYTAQIIWGVTEEEVESNKAKCEAAGKDTDSLYSIGKKVRHSGNYLASWKSLQDSIKCSAAEAKALLTKFYNFNPNLRRWHEDVARQLKGTRTLTSLLGRKRIFFGRIGQDLLRQAVAYNPQETVAHVLNLGIINIYNTLCRDYKDISVKLQVHDSVLIEHPPELKDYIHNELHKLMKIDLKCGRHEFSIPIEVKSGLNWRDLTK